MEKYREKVWFSAGLNICVYGVMLAVMNPFYDNDKDIYMRILVNGALGTNVSDILYQSSFLGKIYSALYGRFGSRFCWYDLFQLAVLLAAFTAITYLVMRRQKDRSGVWISLLFLIFFGYECFVEMNFIKTAGAAAAAGSLLLLSEIGRGLSGGAGILTGALLSLAGALLCLPAFLCCIGLMAPAAVIRFWSKRDCAPKIKTALAAVFFAGCVVFLLTRRGTILRPFLNEGVKSLTFCAFLFAALLWCGCKKKKTDAWMLGAAWFGLWLVLAVAAFEKIPGSGLQEVLCMTGTLVCLTAVLEEKADIESRICAALLIAALVMSQYTWRENWRMTKADERASKVYYQQMLGTIAADREHLYLLAPGTIDYGKIFEPFESMPTEVMGNNCVLDAWIIDLPVCREMMKKYGVEEPFRDMIKNPSAYLVGGDIEELMDEIHTGYDKHAEAVLVREMGDKKIYQIR